ncbi:MAG: signal peptidase II [Treponema sp.]|jgi:signal peptidase II|nr:signal peptidase II [Treponema sp.]
MIQLRTKAFPFLLTALAVGADQLSKFFIVKNWPKNGTFIKDVFGNEFLEIYHVRNTAIAFSLGHNLPDVLRPFLFVLVPAAVLVFLVVYYFKSDEFTSLQRWSVAGILGGGIGNLIDRVFRPEGVVDFISVNFYGFLGFSRWPTFNFADSFVVVFGLLLLVTIFVKDNGLAREAKRGETVRGTGPESDGEQ